MKYYYDQFLEFNIWKTTILRMDHGAVFFGVYYFVPKSWCRKELWQRRRSTGLRWPPVGYTVHVYVFSWSNYSATIVPRFGIITSSGQRAGTTKQTKYSRVLTFTDIKSTNSSAVLGSLNLPSLLGYLHETSWATYIWNIWSYESNPKLKSRPVYQCSSLSRLVTASSCEYHVLK